eukprot:13460682-Ditylum_brightwellii.AAC.2
MENDKKTPGGWAKVTGHIIFNAKMDFMRKARWVLDGHKTPDLNLGVWTEDIQNAYLQALSSQKYYIVCGAEFGLKNVWKQALIRRSLYGEKLAGKDFYNHLRECIRHLGFVACPADPDVWMGPAIHNNGSKYYEYILLYTDDTLIIGEHSKKLLCQGIGNNFQLKEESAGPPKIYLGGSICKRNDPRWTIPAKAEMQMRASHRPKLDMTPVLSPFDSAYYKSLIGTLRLM